MSYGHGRATAQKSGRGIQVRSIVSTPYAITNAMLKDGMNIFGVNYAGAVAITIPNIIPKARVLVFKDESGTAGTNNITITPT